MGSASAETPDRDWALCSVWVVGEYQGSGDHTEVRVEYREREAGLTPILLAKGPRMSLPPFHLTPPWAYLDFFVQVFNLQRLAVLTTALAANPPDPELIYEAMKDRVHQPYRKELVSSYSLHLPMGLVTYADVVCNADPWFTRGDIDHHSRRASWIVGNLSFGSGSYNTGTGN